MLIRLADFIGELPRIISRNLPDTASSYTFNARLDDTALTPYRRDRVVANMPPPVDTYKTIFLNGDEWLAFEKEVHLAAGATDAARLYMTGDDEPKLIYNENTYPLAVNAPTAKLTATLGGTPSSENGTTRLYVYTFVTSLGEESAPCPISDPIYWKPDNTVTLSGFQAAPSGRLITHQRIYRSQTSYTGTQLFFIAERSASTADFVDNIPLDNIAEPLPSLDWQPPIATLKGLTSMPNGMMAAFSGNDVYFAEPYRPHAWPEKYVMTVDYPVVALGTINTSLVVLTTGNPYIISGFDPSGMVMEKLDLNLPCVSSRAAQDLGYAVAYPSHDGLVLVSAGGARLLTEQVIGRNQWRKFNPSSMIAGQYDGKYFASYAYFDTFTQEERIGSFIIDTTQQTPFISRTSLAPSAYYYDIVSGRMYVASGSEIREWDSLLEPRALMEWVSKDFYVPKPTNFGAIMIESDRALTPEEIANIELEIAEITASNEVKVAGGLMGEINGFAINEQLVNGDNLTEIPTFDTFVNVNVYADGVLVASVGQINEIVRLPAGFLARKWRFEITGDTPIDAVSITNTAFELSNV